MSRLVGELEEKVEDIRRKFVVVRFQCLESLTKSICKCIPSNDTETFLQALESVFDLKLIGPKIGMVAKKTENSLPKNISGLLIRLMSC